MSLDDFKNTYQQTQGTTKPNEVLRAMTTLRQSPTYRRMRHRMVIQILGLLAFTFMLFTAFDGLEKPLWAQLVWLFSLLAYLGNEVWGLAQLTGSVALGESLADSLQRQLCKMRTLSVSTWAVSLLLGASTLVFFSATVVFTPEKWGLVAGMGASLLILTYVNARHLRKQYQQVHQTVQELA